MDELTKSYQVMQLTFEKIEQERQQLAKENERLKSHVTRLSEMLNERDGTWISLCMICDQYDFYWEMITCERCADKKGKAICQDCQQKHNLFYVGSQAPPHVISFLNNLGLDLIEKEDWDSQKPIAKCHDCS